MSVPNATKVPTESTKRSRIPFAHDFRPPRPADYEAILRSTENTRRPLHLNTAVGPPSRAQAGISIFSTSSLLFVDTNPNLFAY